MAKAIDTLLALSIPALVLVHLFVAPYTKVEESFNIQAVHDILAFGIPDPFSSGVKEFIQTHYDHATFTGSVPRTFLGATVLTGLARPWVSFLSSPDQIQLLVRAILGLANGFALVRFRAAVDVAYGRIAGRFYLLFVASSFHVLYYSSRTLPNILAFPLTTEALRAFVLSVSMATTGKSASRRRRLSIYLLATAAITFRAEIALLMGAVANSYYIYSRLSLRQELLPALDVAALLALPLTVGLDTLFWLPNLPETFTLPWHSTWTYPLWPELQGFLFNAVSNRSSEWGTSPWHWYFTSALPRLLLNPLIYLLCLPLALLLPTYRRVTLALLYPAFIYISVYSYLPHKEWRFILYPLPLLLAPAAAGASYSFLRRSKSALYGLATLIIILSIPISFLASSSLLALSSLNYPGGHALAELHRLAMNDDSAANVHMTNLALQTGVTRFQETHFGWSYDKSDDQERLLDPLFWAEFDYAIVEDPMTAIGPWKTLGTVGMYDGLGITVPQTDPDHQQTILFPFFLLPEAAGVYHDTFRRHVGSKWPHVRLRTGLWILGKGKMPTD